MLSCFDTAENEPLKVYLIFKLWDLIFHIGTPPSLGAARALLAALARQLRGPVLDLAEAATAEAALRERCLLLVAGPGLARAGLARCRPETPTFLDSVWTQVSPGCHMRLAAGFRCLAALTKPSNYHQRHPLEHTFFGPFRRLVLVCIEANFCK